MLTVGGIHAFYGNVEALKGVDLEVGAGEIVAMIGANGAGKSTLLMTICGNPVAARGRIVFEGRDITHLPTFEIMRLGIAHAPEGRRIFPRMTVLENLRIGAATVDPQPFDEDCRRVFALFPILEERRRQRGGTLSGGEQQMLAIGRALMSRPRLLLLDEPSLGLAPLIVRQIFDAIREINEAQKTTVLLVEQNAYHALRLAHRGYVMQTGRIALSGSGARVAGQPGSPRRLSGGRALSEDSRHRAAPVSRDDDRSCSVSPPPRPGRRWPGAGRPAWQIVAADAAARRRRPIPALRAVRGAAQFIQRIAGRGGGSRAHHGGRVLPCPRPQDGAAISLALRAERAARLARQDNRPAPAEPTRVRAGLRGVLQFFRADNPVSFPGQFGRF